MLNRQKAILRLVSLAGGDIDRLVLTKWAFLLRHESESRGGNSFYDFVPYHFGPFSFGLYQEADKLVSLGYLKERGGSRWCLGDVPPPPVTDSTLQRDLAAVKSRFAALRAEDLLDYVYERYPYFTVNSKRKQLAERPTASLAVYTAGYEGKSVDGFLNGLIDSGIRHLVDVRRNPIARRYGFHRSTLNRLCDRLGIQYSHVPSLGVASEQRQSLNSIADYKALFKKYESTTLKSESAAIETVSDLVLESPTVLVCMEAEASSCHRSCLAKALSLRTRLPIVNLR
jgi:uncharacterized protein (DUF488 family)